GAAARSAAGPAAAPAAGAATRTAPAPAAHPGDGEAWSAARARTAWPAHEGADLGVEADRKDRHLGAPRQLAQRLERRRAGGVDAVAHDHDRLAVRRTRGDAPDRLRR